MSNIRELLDSESIYNRKQMSNIGKELEKAAGAKKDFSMDNIKVKELFNQCRDVIMCYIRSFEDIEINEEDINRLVDSFLLKCRIYNCFGTGVSVMV